MALKKTNIRRYITVKTLPWVFLFIFLSVILIAFLAREIVVDQINSRHKDRINYFENSLNISLKNITNQIANIASNDLVVNGIVDFAAGETYLPPFLRSFHLSSIETANIAITDFRGKILYSSERGELRAYEAGSWVAKVIDDGDFFTELKNGLLFVAAPIFISGSGEGAVIAVMDYRNLSQTLPSSFIDGDIIYIHENSVVYSSDQKHTETYRSKVVDGSLYYEKVKESGDIIVSIEDEEYLNNKILLISLFVILSCVVVILSVLSVVYLSSSLVSKVFNTLLRSLDNLRQGESQHKELGELESLEEFSFVWKKYNSLSDSLTVSKLFSQNIKSIIHSLNEFLVVFDLDGKTKLANHAFERILEDIEGRQGSDFEKIIPDHLHKKAIMTNLPLMDFEEIYKVKSPIFADVGGDETVVRWSRSLFYAEGGELEGVIFIGVDVTKTRKIEKDLLAKSKTVSELGWRLDFALSAANIGVWDFDIPNNKLYWDDRMFSLYGTSPDQFRSDLDSWKRLIHPDDLLSVEEKFYESLANGEDFFCQFRILGSVGQTLWMSARARVIRSEKSLPIRVIGITSDITEISNLTEKLQVALAKAKESVQLKSEFLASMSHEIRTPMNGVLGMLELLRSTKLSGKQEHYLSLAHFSANSLLDLINDILDFSKIEADKLELELVDYHLLDMLGDLMESLAYKAQEKGLNLVFDFSGIAYDIVRGDSGRLRQIITNLLSNAIKFTNEGMVALKVSLVETDDGRLKFIGSIQDTGIGIPEDKVHLLFDSFSQVDASTTRKYGGTGLGLAIVKRLCIMMGGDIQVQSRVAEGSEFLFEICLELSESAKPLKAPNLEDKSILIAEQHPATAVSIQQQLRLWGAEVNCFSGDKEIMAYLDASDTPPDAILIDDNLLQAENSLPHHIASDKQYAHTHLILMSAITRTESYYDAESLYSFIFPKPAIYKDLSSASNVLFADINRRSNYMGVELAHEKVADNRGLSFDAEKKPQDIILSSDHKKKRILLVEDNIVNQEVALGILASYGFDIEVANNGIEALAALEKSSYHLILMDCQMPEMDGYETTRAIRAGKVPGASGIAIVAMTANAMKGDRDKCLAAGMDDYLSKPIDPTLLNDKLTHWLSEDRSPGVFETMTEQPSSTDPVWDREDFMKRVMNNENIANKLIDLFKTDTPKTITELGQAIESKQAESAGLLAHKLKGSVSNLGGVELAAIAQKIEQAGKSQDMPLVESLWPNVLPSYEKLVALIEQDRI